MGTVLTRSQFENIGEFFINKVMYSLCVKRGKGCVTLEVHY